VYYGVPTGKSRLGTTQTLVPYLPSARLTISTTPLLNFSVSLSSLYEAGCAIQQDLDQARMPIERGGIANFQVSVFKGDSLNNPGQVAFQVGSQSKKIGQNDNFAHALSNQPVNRASQIGFAEFQEGGLDVPKGAGLSQSGGGVANGLIGRLHARTMAEDNEAGTQAPTPWI
jgi:hypothetical protein